ncbi:hypothetical protein Cgig2_009685 [Carnegiea gigantea]|uniref:Uncharacterized protein n=1 Tax=Carnegiea gigantea TaxID=171969 RepID=A0A9Q1K5S4_9CARY|nr:hypothetical protein Cgig2_009685 [Carnegiea gigantea]
MTHRGGLIFLVGGRLRDLPLIPPMEGTSAGNNHVMRQRHALQRRDTFGEPRLVGPRRRTYRGKVLDLQDNVLPDLLLLTRNVEVPTLFLGQLVLYAKQYIYHFRYKEQGSNEQGMNGVDELKVVYVTISFSPGVVRGLFHILFWPRLFYIEMDQSHSPALRKQAYTSIRGHRKVYPRQI